MCLAPTLANHMLQQGLPHPSRVTLQRSQIELDLATMIYSRRCILNCAENWFLHLRADSSPQGGRDYFVCEIDILKVGNDSSSSASPSTCVANPTPASVFELLQSGHMTLTTRLLPLSIIGCRAGSACHKAKQLLRALSLDSESLDTSIARTMTMMFDYGAESGPGLDSNMFQVSSIPWSYIYIYVLCVIMKTSAYRHFLP